MDVPNYSDLAGDFPPYGRRRSSPSRTPHRDPATMSNLTDPDTCRICRGESTPTEPLFYPCKCSGSIKYVHQECLMEWLSHSQKKHCELCKTPFRFTKLYSPRMPSTLPTHIFVTHMTRYVVDNLVVWLRALLVGCVWLFWVPYLMRRGWSMLFLLSDEGFGSLIRANSLRIAGRNATAAFTAATNETSVLSTIVSMAENQSAAELLSHNATTSLNETVTGNASTVLSLPYLILGAIFPVLLPRQGESSAQDPAAEIAAQGTLLSNVKFLQNLTRQPLVNRFVITVLEGQIITVLVIICFILVILVRDYVVQQQPEINMRAAFAAAQDEARQEEREAAARAPQPAPVAQAPPPFELDTDGDDDFWDSTDEDDDEEPERDARTLIGEGEDESVPGPESQGRVPAGPMQGPYVAQSSTGAAAEEERPSSSTTSADTESLHQPPDPPRLDEEGRAERLLRMFQETEGDHEAILRVLREENRARPRPSQRAGPLVGEASGEDSSNPAGTESPVTHMENASFIPTPSDSDEAPLSKGKDREAPPKEMPTEDNAPEDIVSLNNNDPDRAPYRRRAVSDGPQPREFANPLANNNWSFSPISTAAPSPAVQAEPIAGPSNTTELPPVEESVESPNMSTDVQAESGGQTPSGRNGMDLVGEETHGWEDEPSTPGGEANGTAPHEAGAAPGQEDPQRPLWARVADFLWGDIGEDAEGADVEGADDDMELVLDDRDDDDVEEHHAHDDDMIEDFEDDEGGPEGLDQEALDDIEDFEGIMELIGMRGPMMGLFQNAVFCACLVLITVFLCIFLPYNLGRTSITIAANPVRVIRMFVSLSTLIQDVVAFVVGGMSLSTLSIVSLVRRVFGAQGDDDSVSMGITYTWEITANASSRLSNGFIKELPVRASEIQNFSAISHHALLSIKDHVGAAFTTLWSLGEFLSGSPVLDIIVSTAKAVFGTTLFAKDLVVATASAILDPAAWIVDLGRAAPAIPINPELASWSGTDRFWAIIAGYLTFALIAGLYVSRWAPVSYSQIGQDWEASVVDVINQASGVTKVILIIGIEMLVFPLYCGLLMDAALLPLFEHATIKSRYEFTMNYPLTSMFVHWFVGTGYMFHFALFVSMCRKIMRKGVLCKSLTIPRRS